MGRDGAFEPVPGHGVITSRAIDPCPIRRIEPTADHPFDVSGAFAEAV
jgi:hypothetical protein